MVMTKLTSDGLSGLCSKEKLQLLDAIDSLRSHGISHYISLPQIIVCGDQSSGKSSVLEAISGVSFPVETNTCTRFPTELVLRKTAHPSVNVRIVPHHSRPESERKTLAGFQETLDAFDELPKLINSAKAAMGITTQGKAFSNDILRIEISGPDRPHLTIVDLPGLIHSETKSQSRADIEMIRKVVKGYMKQPRSIILAVVSAKNDIPNQVVLQLAQQADPKRNRTLGVITKPDTLIGGTKNEQSFIDLVKNKDVELRLGWHLLRNWDSEKDTWAPEERDAQEREFFSQGSWVSIRASHWGIEPLRNRLSQLLVQKISSELPDLISEISAKTSLCQEQLDKLGQPRVTARQQRTYLIQIGQDFQAIVKAATEGNYTNPFFEDAMSKKGYQKRLRAVIQNLGLDFARDLDERGMYIRISDKKAPGFADENPTVTRQGYLDKIVKLMERSRGRELPGMFNPMIVADLFREQSSPWEGLVRAHLVNVWDGVRDFLRHVVKHTSNLSTVETLQEFILVPKLDKIFKALNERIEMLLNQHQEGHPITYNDAFTDTLQEVRVERRTEEMLNILKSYFSGKEVVMSNTYLQSTVDLKVVAKDLATPPKSNMNHFAAQEVLDALESYYKVAMKRFIDDVAVEAIEGILLVELGKMIDPVSVSEMPDDELDQVAGETEASRATRKELATELAVFEGGMQICRQFADFGLFDLDFDQDGSDLNGFDSRSDAEPAPDSDSDSASDLEVPPEAPDLADYEAEIPAEEEPFASEEADPQPSTQHNPWDFWLLKQQPVTFPDPPPVQGMTKKEKKKLKKQQERMAALAALDSHPGE